MYGSNLLRKQGSSPREGKLASCRKRGAPYPYPSPERDGIQEGQGVKGEATSRPMERKGPNSSVGKVKATKQDVKGAKVIRTPLTLTRLVTA